MPRDPVYGDPGGVEPASAMLRADHARAVPFDPAAGLAEGLDWLGRLEDAGIAVRVLDRVLYRKRWHGGNISADRGRLRADTLRMMRTRVARGRGRGANLDPL